MLPSQASVPWPARWVTWPKSQLAAQGITLDSLKDEVHKLMAQTGNPALQPAAIASQAAAAADQMTSAAANTGAPGNLPAENLQGALQRITSLGKATVDQANRESVINVVMARTGVGRQEAEQRTDAWIKQYQEARAQLAQKKAAAQAKARQRADAAASASSKAALGAVAALILGAVAAALGGMTARRRGGVVASAHPMAAG